jgi:hypothetical protein
MYITSIRLVMGIKLLSISFLLYPSPTDRCATLSLFFYHSQPRVHGFPGWQVHKKPKIQIALVHPHHLPAFPNMHLVWFNVFPMNPTPNEVVMDYVYDEKMVEQENYYSSDESSETVQMDGCEASMYIFEEGDKDPNSQESVSQTRGFVNRSKIKNYSEKENQKDKQKMNEKRANEKMTDSIGSKKQHLMSNSTQKTHNVVEDLSKLRITLPFTELMKIPQPRENILILLDDPPEKGEIVVTSLKQSQNKTTAKLRGKIPRFYISIENHDVALHNCLVDTGATNNSIPLVVMEALGMTCTKYYETGESIYAIDSIQVSAYGEIKEFYS